MEEKKERQITTSDQSIDSEVSADEATAAGNDGRIMISTNEKKRKKKKKKKKKSGQLGSARGIETMFRTSYRTHNDLVSLADHKASMLITVNSLVISVILGGLSSKIDTNPELLYPTSVLLVGCVAAMVYAVLAARPGGSKQKAAMEDIRNNRANLLFFGNFAHLTDVEFGNAMKALIPNTDFPYEKIMRED